VSKQSTDILVVGGGIIGMLTARELAMGGARVSLVERQACGRESSWAGGGIVSPLYPWRYSEAVTALASWGQAHYPGLATALQQESGIDPEWIRSGLLMLDVGDETAQALAWAGSHAHEMERLALAGLRELEPALAQGEAALWMPQIGQVRNPRLAQAARGALPVHDIEVYEDTEVQGLQVSDGRIQGVHTDRGRLAAGQVILAGGAWSAQLLQALEVVVEVEPVKGQMILYRTEPGAIRHIVLNQGKYLIPRRDGHLLAGSTLEYVPRTRPWRSCARWRRPCSRSWPRPQWSNNGPDCVPAVPPGCPTSVSIPGFAGCMSMPATSATVWSWDRPRPA